MKRKKITIVFLALLALIVVETNYYTPYDKIVRLSPNSITCTTETIDEVELLAEYILVVSNEGKATRGLASFQTGDKIYIFGHQTDKPVGSLVVKVEKNNNKIKSSNLIGEVILNEKDGVIVEKRRDIKNYSTIPIGREIRLGEASIIGRDDDGEIIKYSINIEAIDKKQKIFYYSSDEIEFKHGTSGSPIVQDNELIGIHFGSTENERIGCGHVIWSLDIVQP